MMPGSKPALFVVALVWVLPLAAQSASSATADPAQGQAQPSAVEEETQEMEAEMAEHDISYLRSRLVFRYDYKSKVDGVGSNRARVKSLFAFGPRRRLAIRLNVPMLYKDAPGDSAGGLGDLELAFGGNFFRRERFRTGMLVEFGLPTSTDPLLGGGTTTIKPAWGFTAIVAPHLELNCTFSYKRSIHTTRGEPTHEFEPDFTLSASRWGVTWWAEWDSYYLFIPEQFAQTFKVGASRSFGRDHRCVVSPYYSFPLNAAGRQT